MARDNCMIEFGDYAHADDIAKAAGEQSAANGAQNGGHPEGNDFGATDVDARGGGSEVVIAHRLHGAAQFGRL